ncbi:MAG: oligosaccharide flippase family protein [Eubacterium coprostanoligenes]|nr:oligosaccharide flippase family protein [Eubacterium coprostanoligenes]
MNKKYKYLFKNIGLLTISNFGGRLLTFLLIPLYTKYLTTSEYGIYDLYTATVELLIPILPVCIFDAVQRFSLNKDSNKSDIFTVGFRNMLKSILIFSLLILINYTFKIFAELNKYPLYLLLFFISDNFYTYFSNVSKGLDNIKDYAVCGFINSATTLLLNILFLTVFHMGIDGYFLANILSYFIAGFYLMIKIKIWNYLKLHLSNKNQKSEMINYSKHLVLSSISWWINNSIDRYFIIWLLGTAENGIYSVAYKIPTIINVVQSIFNQAWTLSAVKEFDNRKDDFYSNTYKNYMLLLIFSCSGLIIFDQLIAKIIYSSDFYIAWKYVPFLLISAVFSALNSFIESIFAASMDSKIIAQTTILGAVINIILNLILIHSIGTMGAAISTMISYFAMWIFKLIKAKKIVNISVNPIKASASVIILLIQSILIIYTTNNLIKYSFVIILFFVIALINIKDLKVLIYKGINLVKAIKQKSNAI